MEDGGFFSLDDSGMNLGGETLFSAEPSGSDLYFGDPDLASVGVIDGNIAGDLSFGNGVTSVPYLPDANSNNTLQFGYDSLGGDYGSGYPGTGSASEFNLGGAATGSTGSPINLTSTPIGGNFGSIANSATGLFNTLAGAINNVSTAVTGRPILSSTAAAATEAQKKQAQMQNMMVIGGLALAAWLIYKKM